MKPCKTTKVKDPYTGKGDAQGRGREGDQDHVGRRHDAMQYPTSLDIGGKGVWLPVNLDSKAPSGYVQVELTQGPKDLAADWWRDAAGESGLRIKVFGKPKPGKATCGSPSSLLGCSGDQGSDVEVRVRRAAGRRRGSRRPKGRSGG